MEENCKRSQGSQSAVVLLKKKKKIYQFSLTILSYFGTSPFHMVSCSYLNRHIPNVTGNIGVSNNTITVVTCLHMLVGGKMRKKVSNKEFLI